MDVVGFGKFKDVFGDVVGGVYCYYFVGVYDVDFFGFVFVDGYCEIVVYDVVEYVVENVVEVFVFVVGVELFEYVD